MLTPDELARYDRQIIMKGFGSAGQERLKQARVLVAGVGGLGSAVALYLVAAGIGAIRLVDHDRVELSNLNRQVLHGEADIGQEKVSSAAAKLRQLNSRVEIGAVSEAISEDNIGRLVSGCDLVVDALDNMPARYILNRAALRGNIPFFHGAVYGLEGRVTTIVPGETACLRCIYRGASPPAGDVAVLGVTPGVIGCIQAAEVIKYVAGIGRLLTNRLLLYDGRDMNFTEFRVKRDPACEDCRDLSGKEPSG